MRDGLVEEVEGGSLSYRLTEAGRSELAAWWTVPVPRTTPARDELAIKLALAVGAPGVDIASVIRVQRTETLRALQDLRRLTAQLPAEPEGDDLAWSLVLDALTFDAEGELRWLDHVEGRLRRARRRTPSAIVAAERTGGNDTATPSVSARSSR